MLMPKVSVLIPTYNYARYLGAALGSVLDQSYPNLEIIVVDDGSTDNTREILRPWGARIRYIYEENGGTARALNTGLAAAGGKYVCWLSSDDVFYSDKVAKQVQLMESRPEFGFSYTSFCVIDAKGERQYDVRSPYYPERPDMVRNLIQGCFINGSTVIIRRTALERTGFFDEAMGTAHDYDLWFRLLRHFDCGALDEILSGYRWHGENGSRCVRPEFLLPVLARARALFPDWLS
ncbi:Glycosyl transferase family 2 [Acididesulfobacillus acetoxydans]|uniref:Glycosyl transferase n=1 Tax=Acididesulfobacillus acetoxydans TaxID=1561005 RepID=A0A8S0XAS9_9FIRM|nr:glycosyltransferase [Acididesulfobacillus acetoxydans]CAA7600336.1 Glycosyl transferase family 2 [Acididesulfobacillus acetoxydans]CEJ07858.1 Glycosyl transferase [Acididesulfobacillus acetoxydans]